MRYNFLGGTDIQVSALGLGLVKIGRNEGVKYPQGFELPEDKSVIHLLELARDLGINTLDTAPAYGSSEERLGKLLPGSRHDWVIGSKVGENFEGGQSVYCYTPEHIMSSVERSLIRLRTDYLDYFLIHSNGEDLDIIQKWGVFEVLNELKKQGKIRATGMSTKTIEGGKKAVDLSDVVMVTYNQSQPEEGEVIDYAQEKNKGILIKKAFGSGHFAGSAQTDNPVQSAMDFVLAKTGVSSVITGTINPGHLKQNASCL